ncbi:MAG: D-alanyl-D-alanine carboxypeptidase family protein [Actinomycetota bacterium]
MRCKSVKSFVSSSVAALVLAGGAHAAGPRLSDARAWYVLNASNGEVVAQHDATARVPIASITKLMTVVVALQHLKPSDTVTVTAEAARVGEERIPLVAGQRITVHDLLEGALIQSANDAADALAAAAAGGDIQTFVGWMNERAQQLGLRDTHFVRPDGLDAAGHLSSARDVVKLAQVAFRIPIVRQLIGTSSATIENGTFTVHTWDDLLGVFPGLVGGKTGHTDDAGWCEVAAVRRGGFTIYAVVLGSPTRSQRNADLTRLLSYGVSSYKTVELVRARTYATAAAPYGRKPLQLVVVKPLSQVVRVGRPLVERIVAPTAVSLPVRRGQAVGRVEIWQGRTLLGSRPLLAGRTVEKPSAFGKVGWYAGRTVHHLLGFFS